MTPETTDYLERAREYLSKARNLVDVLHYGDEGARMAYLAGFHAAQAVIFARRGRVAKTHRGVRSTFALIAKDEPRIDPEFGAFLARAYKSKEITDYGVGYRPTVSDEEADRMIETATRLVACVAELLA